MQRSFYISRYSAEKYLLQNQTHSCTGQCWNRLSGVKKITELTDSVQDITEIIQTFESYVEEEIWVCDSF